MLKLAKYLKPFAVGVAAAVALLFAQALCELYLPSFMSDIVNIGLQQSGIINAAPDAIGGNGMDMITTFMRDDDKRLVMGMYTAVQADGSGPDGKRYAQSYPGAEGLLYIKKDASGDEADALDAAFGKAAWTLVNYLKEISPSAAGGTEDASSGVWDGDIRRLYGTVSAGVPSEALEAALTQADAVEPSQLRQSGVMLAKAFYADLGVDIGAIQTGYILRTGLLMLAVALLGGAATVAVSFISSRVAAGVARNLRKDVFARIESFSNDEFDRFSTASLITRCTNDVTQVQALLTMGIRMICYAPIMGVGGIIMAVGKSSSMSWIIALACVVLLGVILVVMSIAMPRFKKIQQLIDKLNLVTRENLSGLMVIRAFGTQEHERTRFREANGDLTKMNLFINRVMSMMMPAMMLIMNGVTLLIMWVGANSIVQSGMQVGDMMAFIQYAMQIIMSFLMISMMFIFVPRAAVSADRIAEVLDAEPAIKDPGAPKQFDGGMKGVVEFRGVSFRYQGAQEDTLSDISFAARPGETTAIIGSTGSGKSTIVSLIMRFYDVTAGQVFFGGRDVREVTQHDLRGRIGYVPQKGALFTGTIASNIRYGNQGASDGDVRTAAEVAQALGFIDERPEGFDSEIAQGGANVSGGQKQRLAIARALAVRPEVFIFDDSFSALDFKTDAALRKRLGEYTGDSTVIVIAQRVSTIMRAEQILVLDEGRIVGRGTHRELLKTCGQYYEIASSQLSAEELA